ncbi:MAG: DUF6261 family protein [Tannerellaceae bacterium]|jgi:hypothetical protein|nr:DUF6261 family protein [Tannerellaceae bacterium]
MPVLRFNIYKLRNEEWFRFHTEFFDLATLCGPEALNIHLHFLSYCILYKEADGLLELLHKSFITTDTVQADQQRCRIFQGLRNTAKSLQKVLDPAKQNAAGKVYTMMNKYYNVLRKGTQAAKTAAIDNLLQDLTKDEGGMDLSEEVLLLQLGEWVTDLTVTNNAYKQSLMQRTGEAARRPETGRLQQVRAKMDIYYTHMVHIVNAFALIEEENVEENAQPDMPDGKIIHFIKSLNFCVSRYKTLLKGRQTRSRKKGKEEEMNELAEDL